MADSVLANLDSRTTQGAALAPRETHARGVDILNGQWLYDRFIGNDQAERTKMGIVRGVLLKYDTATVKKAIKEMVDIAKEKGEAQLKTARNHQSVMRLAYGALKFAGPELAQQGCTEDTGYQVMRVYAKKALETKGIKWDGSKVASVEEKAQKANTHLAQQAMTEVQKENPQMIGETFADWMTRLQPAIQNRIDADAADLRAEHIGKLADRVIALAGDDLQAVVTEIMRRAAHGEETTTEEEEDTEE